MASGCVLMEFRPLGRLVQALHGEHPQHRATELSTMCVLSVLQYLKDVFPGSHIFDSVPDGSNLVSGPPSSGPSPQTEVC